jgi:beta-N-acetylglucosaminidase
MSNYVEGGNRMKKIINIILVFAILSSYFIPFNFDVYANDCTGYKVSVVKTDGNNQDLSCHTDYNAAKQAMLNHNSDSNNIAVIYNSTGKLVNAKYAIAKFNPGFVISLFPTSGSSSKYTSVHTSYGSDAAFLDYDPSSNRAKVKISGYAGWTSLDNLTILPLTDLVSNTIKITGSTPINIRSSASTTGTILGKAYQGNVYRYYEKKNAEGYTWYRVKYNNQDGWIASLGVTWVVESVSVGLQTYYEAYSTGNLIHYYEHRISGSIAQGFTNLGPYPNFMTQSKTYYSFDSVYFYNTLTAMLDDYRNSTYNNAVNKNNPHYPYYLYLSTHSKTGYTANDFNQIIINKNYTKNMDDSITYVQYNSTTGNYEWVSGVSRTGISLMYNQGQNFVDVANTYGINALMMFGTAINESGTGTSLIAFYKKNLFGLGAIDSDPVNGARTYATVKDSIIDFAKFTGSNSSSYTNPNGGYYFGSHYGNKGSGMNVNYATDPYWGEKQAQNSYLNDRNFGNQDFLANTIGVTKNTSVNIYKNPSTSSSVIYTLKNKSFSVQKMPVIVFDKIDGWYKVYTDVALDENQNIADVDYVFDNSYGYIRESDLYVSNNQPVINASDVTIKQGTSFNPLSGVTATDIEDGNLTSKISVTGDYDVNVIGTYTITYTVTDDSRFSSSKSINLTVNPGDKPIINATDKSISQYVPFDPLSGVTANDYRDGDITSSIEVISNNVNVNVRGSYNVTYRVINSLGISTDKEITVEVIINESPVINASNKIIKLNDIFTPLSGVTATDKEDGNLTSLIQVISNEVDSNVPGVYKVIYEVTDSANNTTTKEINVTVEDRVYTNKKGEFYFEKMTWNSNSQKLDIAGYLAITGMNNTKDVTIKYDLILTDNISGNDIIIELDRWLDNHPSRSYNDGVYNYSATWFKGNLDLSFVPSGEYTLYVRARSGNFQSINLFRNILGKDMSRKVESSSGRGYLFRNNNYKSEYPIELFVRESGLISKTNPTHLSNMFTSYKTLEFKNNSLNIVGTSYNINGDYSSGANVERYLILENSSTFQRYTYNIGSFVGSDIPLRVSDGKSKVRGWFDTTNKVDLADIPVGNYVIYIRTKTGNIDDFGELNDIFLKPTTMKTTINNKEYSINLNRDLRFRIELNVVNK